MAEPELRPRRERLADEELGTYLNPDKGVVRVVVRENPIATSAATFAAHQYVFRLSAGDSVAVTQRDPDGTAETRFFEVREGGYVAERVAPHGFSPP